MSAAERTDDGGGAGGEEVRTVAPPDVALATVPGRIEGRWLAVLSLLVVVGAVGFAVAAASEPTRAWTTVWANFLLWTALAQAGVLFGAVLQTAKGHWGKGFRRLAEGMGAFLPISFLLFLAMVFFGHDHVLPWTGELETHVNREWLNLSGVRWRNALGLLVLYGFSFWYMAVAWRPDAPLVAGKLEGWRARLVGWLARDWRGDEEELERSRRLLGRISPALILLWAGVFTLLSYDLVMSLMPGFISVIWGPYYFVGGWLSMLGLLAVLAWWYRGRHDLAARWGEWEFHDLGKLTFAFAIFWAYLWWSQYLVIWYGNLGRETVFFEQRVPEGSWIYWLQMVLIFGLPFVLLLWRRPKKNPAWLAFVGVIVLAGFWLERHLLVGPSVLEGVVRTGWVEAAVSLGFVGLFGLAYVAWASTFPKLPIRETLVGEASTGP
jgi:hypothetical protein